MANKNRERLLIIATLSVLGLFAGDKFILEPLMQSWSDRSQEIAQLQEKITKGEALLSRKESLREHWKEMLERSLPSDHAAAESEVLAAVNDWGRTAGLNVKDTKQRWSDDDAVGRLFEVRVEATGSLASIARFLYELERDPMAVRLHDYEIKANDIHGQQLDLSARLTGVTLKEKDKQTS